MTHSRILLNDGTSAVLLNDGISFALLNAEGPPAYTVDKYPKNGSFLSPLSMVGPDIVDDDYLLAGTRMIGLSLGKTPEEALENKTKAEKFYEDKRLSWN